MWSRIMPYALALSVVGNGALVYFLVDTHKSKIPKIRHKAWRGCSKIAMQHNLYEQARRRARKEGKKLVVVGNPTGGWMNKVIKAYGCGDICIDIMGCKPCRPGVKILKMDATAALKTIPAGSAIIFESGVFELVKDMKETVRQLDRITGNDITRIFSVHSVYIDEWNYHTKGVRPKPPSVDHLKSRRKDRWGYAKTGEGLARRIIYRFPPRDRYAWKEL